MNKLILHLKTVLKHKYYVLKFMSKAGYFWQGLIHDLSKFHPIEFLIVLINCKSYKLYKPI